MEQNQRTTQKKGVFQKGDLGVVGVKNGHGKHMYVHGGGNMISRGENVSLEKKEW